MNRFVTFREKEVINCVDGKILGCVCDLIIDEICGSIMAIVVPGSFRWNIFAKGERNIVIPWKKIKKIGKDVIIVELDCHETHIDD